MAASADFSVVEDLIKKITGFTSKPENFLGVQTALSDNLRNTTKTLYDFTKSLEHSTQSSEALPELIVDHFDEEQIWQEIELQNKPCISDLVQQTTRLQVGKSALGFGLIADDDDDDSNDDEENDDEEGDVEDDDEEENDSAESDDDLEELKTRLGVNKGRTIGDADESDDSDFADFNEYEVDEEQDNAGSGAESDGEGELGKGASAKGRLKKRKTIVDDKFFKMADMEDFLEKEDVKFERGDKGDEDDDSDDEDMELEEEDDTNMMYTDFFDEPEDSETKHKKKVKFVKDMDEDGNTPNAEGKLDLLDSGSSDGEDVQDILGGKTESKSTYEMRQERLKKQINKMEEANLAEKPWQLAGETSATTRPENSLLEEVLDFEHTTKLAPVITEETTKSLEDLIKQRVKDKAFDDVERKAKPTENPMEYKKRIVLDQEKSKKSLGEIYEQEYLKEQEKQESDDEMDAQHEEIQNMLQTLFVKLDALSNFHYTPKPAAPEVRIISNLPSISMEEVAPVSVSAAALLAPEEVQDKTKGEVKGQTEKSDTDRKRERREKKSAKRARRKEKEHREKLVEKMNPGLGNKYSKEKAMERLEKESKSSKNVSVIKGDKSTGSLTSSKSFFTQLQDEVTKQIKTKKDKPSKKKEKLKDSQKFKL